MASSKLRIVAKFYRQFLTADNIMHLEKQTFDDIRVISSDDSVW